MWAVPATVAASVSACEGEAMMEDVPPIVLGETRIARVAPWHRYLNTHARDGRVLLIGDAQVFDLEMPIVYSTCFGKDKWLADHQYYIRIMIFDVAQRTNSTHTRQSDIQQNQIRRIFFKVRDSRFRIRKGFDPVIILKGHSHPVCNRFLIINNVNRIFNHGHILAPWY